jgi:hypothetical protein
MTPTGPLQFQAPPFQASFGQRVLLVLILCLCGVEGHFVWGQGKSVHEQSSAEAPRYVQTHWTARDGLPVNSVNDLVQTADRHLWLATFDGLVRFDGQSFTTFPSSC